MGVVFEYIDNLLLNARTFDRWVVQWYFENWEALNRDNTRIWNSYYRTKPLFDHLPTWQDWLPEYRQLIIEVQGMVEEHTAQGTWIRRPSRDQGHALGVGALDHCDEHRSVFRRL